MSGFRGRLIVTFVSLVTVTALVLGLSAYLFTERSLRSRLTEAALEQATFNLTRLVPQRLPPEAGAQDVEASGLDDDLVRRGTELFIDFGDEQYASRFAFQATPALVDQELVDLAERGRLAHQWLDVGGLPYLVVAGRQPPDGPVFYFFSAASDIEAALTRLRLALLAGGIILVALAALLGRFVADRVLRPVRAGSLAAQQMAEGDLSVRLESSSSDEFGSWAASFNRMAGALEEKILELQESEARQRRFVSDVSHELRTPVTALVNEAIILRDRLARVDPERRRLAELMVTDVTRLRTLIEDLMEISRFDAATEELVVTTFELRPFLQAVVSSRLPEAQLRVPAQAVMVQTDRRRLERILGNLLDNAAEHAQGTEVHVRVEETDGSLRFEVADAGPGVGDLDLDRIFERFFKADPSRRRGGSGLGLAIAQENARLLGGRLGARARPGGGLVFELVIPDTVTSSLPDRDGAVTE